VIEAKRPDMTTSGHPYVEAWHCDVESCNCVMILWTMTEKDSAQCPVCESPMHKAQIKSDASFLAYRCQV
jgi:uncharacterized paraquat-inducible protein A